MLLNDWYQTFLASRNLESPTSRPLYNYRVTDEEYASLKSALADYVGKFNFYQALNSMFSALFVLYASEWWRRYYDGSGFAWRPITDTISMDEFWWDTNQRELCIRRGFSQWNIKLNDNGLRYLGSVAYQGGLPMQLLSTAHGNIGRLLSNVLHHVANNQVNSIEIEGWIESSANQIPMAYRRREVYVLLAEMVSCILNFKADAQLNDAQTAIEKLNLYDPNWRDGFPLSVNDNQTVGLIERLIKDASIVAQPTKIHSLSVTRNIEYSNGGQWQFFSKVELPTIIKNEVLKNLFSIDDDALPTFLDLNCQTENHNATIQLRRLAGTSDYKTYQPQLQFEGVPAMSEHIVKLIRPNEEDKICEIPRGELMEEDLPWLFEADENSNSLSFKFIRQGTGSIPSRVGGVCIPNSWSIAAVDTQSDLPKSLGFLSVKNRQIWQIAGINQIKTDDGQELIIKCGQLTEITHFDLRGQRVWDYFIDSIPAFKGLPRLMQVNESTGISQRCNGQISVKRQGGQFQNQTEGVFGPVVARWPETGPIKWKRKLVILPNNAELSIQPDTNHVYGGVVQFTHWALVSIHCSTEHVEFSSSSDEEECNFQIKFTGTGNPPEWLDVEGVWRNNLGQARFRIPFPAHGIRILGGSGNDLQNGELITMKNLIGTRLLGYQQNASIAYLNIKLNNSNTEYNIQVRPTNESNKIEVRLIDFREIFELLFSSTNNLDSMITIKLNLSTGVSAHIKLARYSFELEIQGNKYSIPAVNLRNIDISELSQIEVLAIPMFCITKEPIKLPQNESEGVKTGEWEINDQNLEEGPWLIYPSKSNSVYFRPTLRNVGHLEYEIQDETRKDISISEAVKISNLNSRNEYLGDAISYIAADYSHPDWALIETLANQFDHLPLSTFNIWDRWVKDKKAVSALVFRFGNIPEHFFERFAVEMPFLWEFVDLISWKDAMDKLIQQCELLSIPSNITNDILNRRIENVSSHCPSIRTLLEIAKSQATRIISKEMKLLMNPIMDDKWKNDLFGQDEGLLQQLLRRNVDREWVENDFQVMPILTPDISPLLCTNDFGFKMFTVNTPIKIAIYSSGVFDANENISDNLLNKVRQTKVFDKEWFESAFDLTIRRCLSKGFINLSCENEKNHE